MGGIHRFFLGFRHGYSVQKQIREQREAAQKTVLARKSSESSFFPLITLLIYLAIAGVVLMVVAAIVKWAYTTLFG